MYKANENNSTELANDCILRQTAIDALIALTVYSKKREIVKEADNHPNTRIEGVAECIDEIEDLPSAQPEPLSNAYMKAVWTWLIDYQIKVAELKGRYTPYEVLSWVANDWRKEHEQFDRETGGN